MFTFLHTIIQLPLHTLNPLFTATGEIDNLIVSWEQSSWLCCVQVPLLLGEDTPTSSLSGALVWSVMKLASITF
jgi:hypothetical protein